MSGKKAKGKSDNSLEQEDVLQAVVIADSFNTRFAPVSLEKPRALLPLVNCPIIDYTLEFLATNGVQEIFVFCSSHSDQIKRHVEKCKWNKKTSPCRVCPVLSEGCHSLGDALREMERKSLIRSHFVLVTGDLVSNLKLKEVLEMHKNRFQKDKLSAITLVFKEAYPGHRSRSTEGEFVVALDSNKQISHYQKVQKKREVHFPARLFKENSRVNVRYNLLNTHICICSPRVSELFVDNFDYQTMDDFIKGVLVSEEIEGNKLFMHIIKEDYAGTMTNLPLYDAISKDVIHRWAFPMVPDNLSVSNFPYSLSRHNVYLAKDVTLEKDCVLEEDVVIGPGSHIGVNTRVTHSVIGRNCKIGDNVVLENAYIWDNVTIEANCHINMALLCDSVHVKSEVTIKNGCVLSFGVKVGPHVTLPSGTLLTRIPPSAQGEDGDDFQDTSPREGETPGMGLIDEASVDRGLVGEEGEGYVWRLDTDEDDDDELVQQMLSLNLTPEGEEEEEEEEESEESDDDLDDEGLSPPASPPPDDTKLFYSEVLDSLQRTIEENIKVDNLILEINSSKYAYNIAMHELIPLVMKAILEMPHLKASGPLSSQQLLLAVKKLFVRLKPLFSNYIKGAESQKDCLNALEEYSMVNESTAAIFAKLVHHLYDADILSEEVILKWYSKMDQDADTRRREVRSKLASFVTWLQEAEEESDEEGD
ncbi:translation initiation factor eIF-2B subunit epsilon [Strongylocentrotus purpuratus]|uniref:Translation initiation factor eIF2B subunit epsilon n=1 Tax=Strongylocentrotus purpuratus TaxID=7668 RepID=A0A7M7N9G7_STRPU|nr:translation initiation factor eIF-2B subunit epsilon [Strongylocentrotus purpuratus]